MEERHTGEVLKQALRSRLDEVGAGELTENELLQMLLFYIVPKEKVEKTAKNLLDHFNGSFKSVFYAEIEELCKVEGISKNSAAMLKLVMDSSRRARLERNEGVKKLETAQEAKRYVENMLSNLKYERVVLITMNSENEVINCYNIADGTVNVAETEPMKFVRCALGDNASALIVAHNHPDGSGEPSRVDRRFTQSLGSLFSDLGIELKDHIIVGKNATFSFSEAANKH